MTTDVADRVSAVVEPLVAAHRGELYDVVLGGATLRILVAGDLDLDALARLTRDISAALDEVDPMTDRYTLEVSSPGLERVLRTPRHFAGAVGERVKIKARATVEPRRVEGSLAQAGEDGIAVDTEAGRVHLSYDEIDRARTVFEWGAAAKPVSPSRKGQSS